MDAFLEGRGECWGNMKTGFGAAIFAILASLLLLSVSAHPLTALEKRIDDHPYDTDFIFHLANVSASDNGVGAKVKAGAVDQFHALNGLRISNSMFTLDPCGMNLPHVHPRATEEIYVMAGTNLTIGFAEENGGRTILNTIEQGWNAVFPMGLPHFQINNSCEEVQFLSSLSHEDPGVITLPDLVMDSPLNAWHTSFNVGLYVGGTDVMNAKIDVREMQQQCLHACNSTVYTHCNTTTPYNTTSGYNTTSPYDTKTIPYNTTSGYNTTTAYDTKTTPYNTTSGYNTTTAYNTTTPCNTTSGYNTTTAYNTTTWQQRL